MKRKLLGGMLAVLAPVALWAQSPQRPVCGTDEHNAAALGVPVDQLPAALEALRGPVGPAPSRKTNTYSGTGSKTKYVIPYVIHVIHSGFGQTDSITLEQAQNQALSFFRDLRKEPETIGFGGEDQVDMQIEFQLATRDPNGNLTTGVTYLNNPTLADLSKDNENAALKAARFWPRNKYLNVYLVRRITSSGQFSLLAGYAVFPKRALDPDDGIVVLNDDWGQIGTAFGPNELGRVPTHEVGHWINLFHTFQSGCGSTNCGSTGDQVCDTPPTADPNQQWGGERKNTCNSDGGGIDRLDNLRNYMDYSQDFYHNGFTQGQKNRMETVMNDPLEVQRQPLWQETNLEATGTGKWGYPIAGFHADRRVACVGARFKLLDYSQNLPTSYKWIIPGATFLTSDEAADPEVSFAQPGSYDVTLIVQNLNREGKTDTVTKVGYLTVVDTVASVPFREGFENNNRNLPLGWVLDNQDAAKDFGGIGWEVYDDVNNPFGGFGQSDKSLYMANFNYNDLNQVDGIVSPAISLSGSRGARLKFNVAYRPIFAPLGGNINFRLLLSDTLRVYASSNCGETWTRIYQRGGIDLATAPTSTSLSFFTPTATQWRTDSVNLDNYAGSTRMQLRFESKNGWGGNIYIDDIAVDTLAPTTTAVDPTQQLGSVNLAPNPTRGESTLLLNLNRTQALSWTLHDVNGRVVARQDMGVVNSGNQMLPVSIQGVAGGVYLFRLQGENGLTHTQKLILQP